jgi:hypothetical protein
MARADDFVNSGMVQNQQLRELVNSVVGLRRTTKLQANQWRGVNGIMSQGRRLWVDDVADLGSGTMSRGLMGGLDKGVGSRQVDFLRQILVA